MKKKLVLFASLWMGVGLCADSALIERGSKEEARNCTACHSLRLVDSQRLSKTAWGKELDKMAGWGARIDDRDALLEYLSENFGEDKPLPTTMTQNGSSDKPKK